MLIIVFGNCIIAVFKKNVLGRTLICKSIVGENVSFFLASMLHFFHSLYDYSSGLEIIITSHDLQDLSISEELIYSTHPTVVMVTKAHQKPSQVPLINGRGNSSGFFRRSCKEDARWSVWVTREVNNRKLGLSFPPFSLVRSFDITTLLHFTG